MSAAQAVSVPELGRCESCHEAVPVSELDPNGLGDCCAWKERTEAGKRLTPRLNISQLVAIYEQAEADMRTGFALIARAEEQLRAAYTLDGSGNISAHARYNTHFDFAKPEDQLTEMRRDVWQTLVGRLELRRMMSMAAWTKLERDLERGEVLPITVETVSAMVAQFTNALPEMLAEAVTEVFDWLRPPGSRYKTNTELEIGRKVCLTSTVERGWGGAKMRVNYHAQPRITALENVFSALDGKGQITKSYKGLLGDAIENCERGQSGETEYFRFRAYLNGSLHLEFRRLDLLKRFNQIAGGKRLRPKGESK